MSANATLGVSTGVTPGLTTLGQLAIIATMFVGRVGLFAVLAAISIRTSKLPATDRPAREGLVVG